MSITNKARAFFLAGCLAAASGYGLDVKGICLVGNKDSVQKELTREGVFASELAIPNEDVLMGKLQVYLQKPFSEELLIDLQKVIAKHYEEEGRPLVLIGIPEQEISSGCLQLTVTESKLGEVRIKGNQYFSEEGLKKQLGLKPGDPIDEKALMQKVSYINRNPYRRSQFVYTPGQEPEETDLELIVRDREPFKFYIGSENTGRKQLGRVRFFSGFQWGKAFGMEDHTLSYQAAFSENFVHYKGHTVNYTIYFPNKEVFQLFGGYSNVHALPVDGLAQSHGFTAQASFRCNIPIKSKNPEYVQDFIYGFDFKRMNTTTEFEVLVTPRRHNVNLTQLALGYLGSLDTERFDMTLEFNAFYSPGTWIGDQHADDYSQLRPNTRPTYAYAVTKIAGSYLMESDFTFSGMIQSQWSPRNLMPSEQMALGGHNTVRGYDEGFMNADMALVASAELKTPSIRLIRSERRFWKDSFQALAFIDYAIGGNHKASPGVPKKKWLLSIGPGLRYNISTHFSLRFDWGIRLHDGGLRNSLVSFGTVMVF